ncbi:MAG: Kae1-associated kinase Bud32 [Candidatus Bathyarchaeota archaeon]|nr:Kae1-associated kinase Bud32 [Candidatus Bathyarchaeota archaeon]MCX8177321.1 Kae1-associated kinase Bud32 [Candidatus Bathyarchaeota archaeon]MDW8193767.1 Kae1-associated kinase Bud32 [Nitrososphaerota archaeon]
MGRTYDAVNLKLIKKGAEAWIYLAEWHGREVVIKRRLPKSYRIPELDEQIRIHRTIREPQLMHEAKKAGVPTPTIYFVDVKEATIIMERVEGEQVKLLLDLIPDEEKLKICYEIGMLIGKLHRNGIIHGDLTTSNMIQNLYGKIFFIDFGLGEKTHEVEARGVDLHLMRRALNSSHFSYAKECFDAIIKGYSNVLGDAAAGEVMEKIKEIERRGRYVTERKSKNQA